MNAGPSYVKGVTTPRAVPVWERFLRTLPEYSTSFPLLVDLFEYISESPLLHNLSSFRLVYVICFWVSELSR